MLFIFSCRMITACVFSTAAVHAHVQHLVYDGQLRFIAQRSFVSKHPYRKTEMLYNDAVQVQIARIFNTLLPSLSS